MSVTVLGGLLQAGTECVGDRSRIFKVVKTPVPLDKHPPELALMLGYEFFKTDPETGRVRELDNVFGAQAAAGMAKLNQAFWQEIVARKLAIQASADPAHQSPDVEIVQLATQQPVPDFVPPETVLLVRPDRFVAAQFGFGQAEEAARAMESLLTLP